MELTDFLFEKSDDTDLKLESFSYLPSSSFANWANVLIAITWTFVCAQEILEPKKSEINLEQSFHLSEKSCVIGCWANTSFALLMLNQRLWTHS